MSMSDVELVSVLNGAVQDAVIYNGDFMAKQERQLKYYKREPFGDEQGLGLKHRHRPGSQAN